MFGVFGRIRRLLDSTTFAGVVAVGCIGMGIALAQRISGALSEEIATAERRLAELQQEVGAAWAAANKPYTCPDCGRMFTAAGMADHRDDGPCEPYKADESAEEVTEVP